MLGCVGFVEGHVGVDVGLGNGPGPWSQRSISLAKVRARISKRVQLAAPHSMPGGLRKAKFRGSSTDQPGRRFPVGMKPSEIAVSRSPCHLLPAKPSPFHFFRRERSDSQACLRNSLGRHSGGPWSNIEQHFPRTLAALPQDLASGVGQAVLGW